MTWYAACLFRVLVFLSSFFSTTPLLFLPSFPPNLLLFRKCRKIKQDREKEQVEVKYLVRFWIIRTSSNGNEKT